MHSIVSLQRRPESNESGDPSLAVLVVVRDRTKVATAVIAAFAAAVLAAGPALAPPAVVSEEAHPARPDGPVFDHSLLDALLRETVDADGWVDYEKLAGDPARLDRYVSSLAEAPFDELGRNEKLALLINAYNAFTLRLILDHYPLDSIRDIDAKARWDGRTWKIGSRSFTLNEIEHEQIRPAFREPRIHFALNCASVSCPPLRGEAYVGSRLDDQLEAQMRYCHARDPWFRFVPDEDTVELSSLYLWYGDDFRQSSESVLAYAARYAPDLRAVLERGSNPGIRWLDYDWSLNDRKRRPAP